MEDNDEDELDNREQGAVALSLAVAIFAETEARHRVRRGTQSA